MMGESPYSTGNKDKVIVGLNMGASEFYNKSTGKYDMEFKPDGGSDSREWITGSKLGNFYKELVDEFKIEFIEDAFGREDWKSWVSLLMSGLAICTLPVVSLNLDGLQR